MRNSVPAHRTRLVVFMGTFLIAHWCILLLRATLGLVFAMVFWYARIERGRLNHLLWKERRALEAPPTDSKRQGTHCSDVFGSTPQVRRQAATFPFAKEVSSRLYGLVLSRVFVPGCRNGWQAVPWRVAPRQRLGRRPCRGRPVLLRAVSRAALAASSESCP